MSAVFPAAWGLALGPEFRCVIDGRQQAALAIESLAVGIVAYLLLCCVIALYVHLTFASPDAS